MRVTTNRWNLSLLLLLVAVQATAFSPKEPQNQLDQLVLINPQLRVVEVSTDADTIRDRVPQIESIDAFRSQHGQVWRFTIDERRGIPSLMRGGTIPFIPGPANSISWQPWAPGCEEISCLPIDRIEAQARALLDTHRDIFGIDTADLVLDPGGSLAIGSSIYLLRFQWQLDGVPVERGSVFFRINNGNLIHVATRNIGPIELSADPSLQRPQAWKVVEDYLGPFSSDEDEMLDDGSLAVVPVTPAGQDPNAFEGSLGSGIDYRLTYRFSFLRPGVIGTWEALVDAHSGELLRFVDVNRYGRVHGGAYPGDGHTGEADRPFPFADTGLPAPNDYADAGGLFSGDTATTTLRGKYTWIDDSCGNISNSTSTGDVNFSQGPGTDCDVPDNNSGGAGNTHAARTQYYHLTSINIKARTYFPNNSFLNDNHMTVYVNQSPWCNATSGGQTLNFYQADTGCWNLGELPGVSLHEWGHSMDSFDGSGGSSPPVETRADWTAILQTHDSCVGRGSFSGNCGGYGDPCLTCDGIRDSDYEAHQDGVPWTAANYGTFWSCSGGSYYGPCGWSDHCESGISTQALWDLVVRDLTGPPSNMDVISAWALVDRLFYTSMPSLGDMYNCTAPSSDGCNGDGLYHNLMAMDDDGDGTGNGTPHAAAIFAALDRHNIACGAAGDPENQNQTSCPTLAATTVSTEAGNNQVDLSWTAVAGASRYLVFRNEIDCDAGYTKIAEVTGTTYDDTTVVNGIEYYYRVQAATAFDACTSPMSACATATPVPCATAASPTLLTAAAGGDNRIVLSWTNIDPVAETFNVYRAIGACPGGSYELVASGLSSPTFADDPISGGVTFAYQVTGVDTTGGCESQPSNCSATQTTGVCTLPPTFAGIESVSNVGGESCALVVGWTAADAECGGAVTYNVYRSTISGFTPHDSNRVAANVPGTSHTDLVDLIAGNTYYYVIRAVDQSNGAEDDNSVELSGAPFGEVTVRFSDDFESGNQGWVFALGTPAANTGDFLIGDPVGTSGNYGDPSQPEDDHTPGAGVNCLYSDENPTGQGPTNDIDGGEVMATSPSLDGTGVESLVLDLRRWFFNEDNDDAGDYFFLEVSDDDGASWTVLENIPGTDTSTNSWMNVSFNLGDFVSLTSTMKIRVRAADGPATGDLVEAAIDDVVVTGYTSCETSADAPFFRDGFENGTTSAWPIVRP